MPKDMDERPGASNVKVENSGGQLRIMKSVGLQIVNGGQSTA